MKKIILYIVFIVSTSIATGCGSKPAAEESQNTGSGNKDDAGGQQADISEAGPADASIAELTAEQVSGIGIMMGSIEEKQLTTALKTNGVLRVPNQNKASINSLYSGIIKSLLVQPGNFVRKGQAIATIANPDFMRVQGELLNVRSRIQLAELEVTRQRELNQGNAGALKNLQSAESELRSLRTMRAGLSQQVRLMGINPDKISDGRMVSVLTVTSPIAGVVSNVVVKMGSYVDLTTLVAEVVDNSSLHLDLFVYEKDLPGLRNNQLIHFAITNNAVKEYDAKIFSLGSSFEGESKAVTVHAMVEGDKTGLIDGMNVTAVISLEKATVPAVPSDAIVNVAGQDYIFVQVEDSSRREDVFRFERVPIARGGSEIGYTEITPLKPVVPGAKIVTRGAFFVSAKMTNTEDE